MSVVRREYLHMAGEKIDQNKLALCVRAFRAGVVLALPSIWIVFLCGRFCTSFLRHFKQLGWLSFQIMTLFVGNCFLFWAKNFCIRSLCYRTNFVIPAQMYFYFVIFCIWHNHWNSLLFVLWHFVHAPCHCCDVFCIFGICVCIVCIFRATNAPCHSDDTRSIRGPDALPSHEAVFDWSSDVNVDQNFDTDIDVGENVLTVTHLFLVVCQKNNFFIGTRLAK